MGTEKEACFFLFAYCSCQHLSEICFHIRKGSRVQVPASFHTPTPDTLYHRGNLPQRTPPLVGSFSNELSSGSSQKCHLLRGPSPSSAGTGISNTFLLFSQLRVGCCFRLLLTHVACVLACVSVLQCLFSYFSYITFSQLE